MSIAMGLIIISIFLALVCFLAFYLARKEKERLKEIENFTEKELEEYNTQIEEENQKRKNDDFWFFAALYYLGKK